MVRNAEEMLGLLDAWGIPRARRLALRCECGGVRSVIVRRNGTDRMPPPGDRLNGSGKAMAAISLRPKLAAVESDQRYSAPILAWCNRMATGEPSGPLLGWHPFK